MENKHPIETSVWKLLSAIGAVSVVVATGTWTIAQLQISNELESYRAANDWNAKEVITNISTLSDELTLKITERNELLLLREKNKEISNELDVLNGKIQAQKESYENKISAVSKDLESISIKYEALKGKVDALVKEPVIIEIVEREAKYVIPDILLVAVQDAYGSFATVRVDGGVSFDIHPGQSVVKEVAGMKFNITAMKISHSSCTFLITKHS